MGFSRNKEIKYVLSKQDNQYEIEVPNDQMPESKRPKDFELSSQR